MWKVVPRKKRAESDTETSGINSGLDKQQKERRKEYEENKALQFLL